MRAVLRDALPCVHEAWLCFLLGSLLSSFKLGLHLLHLELVEHFSLFTLKLSLLLFQGSSMSSLSVGIGSSRALGVLNIAIEVVEEKLELVLVDSDALTAISGRPSGHSAGEDDGVVWALELSELLKVS